jgi:hypothetical protein
MITLVDIKTDELARIYSTRDYPTATEITSAVPDTRRNPSTRSAAGDRPHAGRFPRARLTAWIARSTSASFVCQLQTETPGLATLVGQRDRWFESGSLQRGVSYSSSANWLSVVGS